MKKLLKSIAGRALHLTGLHRRLLNDTGVIVAFHRVDDRVAGDALTVSVEAFNASADSSNATTTSFRSAISYRASSAGETQRAGARARDDAPPCWTARAAGHGH